MFTEVSTRQISRTTLKLGKEINNFKNCVSAISHGFDISKQTISSYNLN